MSYILFYGITAVVTFIPSLAFNDARNSQYIVITGLC